MTSTKERTVIKTDGSYLEYLGEMAGGWAIEVHTEQGVIRRTGKVKNPVSSRHCELYAIYEACKFIKKEGCAAVIQSDCKEVINTFKGIKGVAFCEDLWCKIRDLNVRNLKDIMYIARENNEGADHASRIAARSLIAR
ncbi:RNase H family protein [Kurthia sp. Dielmo]|uniref:RNase H family protein n=1 Tax=Kurthia sp. Dielmo TaxID=1033738 RepID=UPI00111D5C6B|nr:RNase H family protein [Kurthia sp. Dielmo]